MTLLAKANKQLNAEREEAQAAVIAAKAKRLRRLADKVLALVGEEFTDELWPSEFEYQWRNYTYTDEVITLQGVMFNLAPWDQKELVVWALDEEEGMFWQAATSLSRLALYEYAEPTGGAA